MPIYPSSFSNTGPYASSPQNNTQLFAEIHNRMLRHNLVTVARVVDANISLSSQFVGIPGVQFYDAAGTFNGLATGSVVVLSNQVLPSQNGVYVYSGGATGTAMTGGVGAPFNGVGNFTRFAGGTISAQGTVAQPSAWAASSGSAIAYLNNLFNPTGSSLVTGSSTAFQGTWYGGLEVLADQAGMAYPQGFQAVTGSTSDSPISTSNANRIVYYTNEVNLSSTIATQALGVQAIAFSTVQKVSPVTLPTSQTIAGTDRLAYHTSTMGDFFINIRATSDLIQQIINFRDGNASPVGDLSAAQMSYLANAESIRLNRIKLRFMWLLDDLYYLYRAFYNTQVNYTLATGPSNPSNINRGYNIYKQY